MRVPTYGTVVSLAATLGVLAFVGVLIIQSPPLDGRRERTAAAPQGPPSDPDDLQKWLTTHPTAAFQWLVLGNARHDAGRHEEARWAWEKSRALYLDRVVAPDRVNIRSRDWYNLSCCHARLGEADAAIDALRKAVAAGWGDPEYTSKDPDFESLLDDHRFQEIVRTMPERPRVISAG